MGQRQFKKRWGCPADETLAGYVDQALEDSRKTELQEHLAGCGYCRSLVAEIVTLQRVNDMPQVPAGLIQKVRVLAPATPRRWAWGWATVATAGTLACAVIAGVVLSPPQTLKIPEWPAPAAPVATKSEPPRSATPPGGETVRSLKSPDSLPTILSPRASKAIARDRLEFRWREVPDSLYYQVRILTPRGDLVWETDSTTTHITFPKSFALTSGKYFVLVSAVMKSGKTRKSNPVEFQVSGSR